MKYALALKPKRFDVLAYVCLLLVHILIASHIAIVTFRGVARPSWEVHSDSM